MPNANKLKSCSFAYYKQITDSANSSAEINTMEKIYPLQPPSRHRLPSNPMRVLCLGLSRSGTDSLRTALLILGFRDVYHGFTITAYQREDCAFWVPLLRRKITDVSTELRNVDFDSVLGACDAVTDGPANAFGPELLQYYPDAQVVLNRRRNTDAWHASMRATCLQVFSWPMWVLSWFDIGLCWLWWNFKLVMSGYYGYNFEHNGKRIAEEHYERLERILREQGRQWLDWGVEDGWFVS